MKTAENDTSTDKARLQETMDRLAKGIPFTPEERAEARKHMDRIREENRRLFGETNIAVDLIRQTRDGA